LCCILIVYSCCVYFLFGKLPWLFLLFECECFLPVVDIFLSCLFVTSEVLKVVMIFLSLEARNASRYVCDDFVYYRLNGYRYKHDDCVKDDFGMVSLEDA